MVCNSALKNVFFSFQEKNSVLILPTFVGGTFKLCENDKILVISSLTGKIVQKVWDKEE